MTKVDETNARARAVPAPGSQATPSAAVPASSPAGADSSRWQPIETAPRDGTQILVGVWVAGYFKGSESRWSCWTIGQHGSGDFGCDGEWGDEPTHWMPLPPPPDAAHNDIALTHSEAYDLANADDRQAIGEKVGK